MSDPLSITVTTETGRRVGSIGPTNEVPLPVGSAPFYLIGPDGNLYISQKDDEEEDGLIIEVAT